MKKRTKKEKELLAKFDSRVKLAKATKSKKRKILLAKHDEGIALSKINKKALLNRANARIKKYKGLKKTKK